MSKSKLRTILLIIFIAILAVLSSTTLTLAIWKEQINAERTATLPLADAHPSLKYIAFEGIDANGKFTTTNPTAYAVVGYSGLVAEVVIPDTYSGKKVTHIMPNAAHQLNQFKNNEVIKSLTLSCNITHIAPTMFSNMLALEWVKFMDKPYSYKPESPYESGSVSIGEYAFMGSTKLTKFACNRAITGSNRDSYLLNTGVR